MPDMRRNPYSVWHYHVRGTEYDLYLKGVYRDTGGLDPDTLGVLIHFTRLTKYNTLFWPANPIWT